MGQVGNYSVVPKSSLKESNKTLLLFNFAEVLPNVVIPRTVTPVMAAAVINLKQNAELIQLDGEKKQD